jgi:transaldolase
MTSPLEELRAAGQSIWLDYIRRGLITSGGLARFVRDDHVTGVTSNPTIFQKAIAGSTDYNEALRNLAAKGPISGYEGFLAIGAEDIRMAADVLRPAYDDVAGADGFVSFEAQAGSTEAMTAEARRMFEMVGRPNVMIKIPGVPEGVQAVEELTAAGLNINITLLFDVDAYESFARAYIRGLKRRVDAGEPIDTIASVASFFVSRIDTKVDEMLPEGSRLRGEVAIANARLAYKRFQEIFSGPEWEHLRSAGAKLQRPLWASTGTKNPAYSDVLYVEELVAPDTVNTMPEATLRAFADHGRVRPNIVEESIEDAERVLREAAAAGIDIKQVARECLDEGLASFEKDFARLIEEIEKALRHGIAAEGACRAGGRTPAPAGRAGRMPPNLGRRPHRLEARPDRDYPAEPARLADSR